MSSHVYSRRKFITHASATLTTLALCPSLALAALPRQHPLLATHTRRTLKMYNRHTGEKAALTYWQDGHYIQESLIQLDYFLRDHRNDTSIAMSTQLLDGLFLLKEKLGCTQNIDIISGYRSKESNEKLRRVSNGVAKNSFHTRGKAIDIALPNIALNDSYRAARNLKLGGVGRYSNSGFIHLDTGPIRSWAS